MSPECADPTCSETIARAGTNRVRLHLDVAQHYRSGGDFDTVASHTYYLGTVRLVDVE